MQDNRDYKSLLCEYIKKQIVILGPTVALSKAKKIQGLNVGNDGVVKAISGDSEEIGNKLVGEFVVLEGEIAKSLFLLLLEKYPESAGAN